FIGSGINGNETVQSGATALWPRNRFLTASFIGSGINGNQRTKIIDKIPDFCDEFSVIEKICLRMRGSFASI
ncbi:MAG: hypothetical protein RLZZ176_1892, partial [Cyanobacteriota bacterium]